MNLIVASMSTSQTRMNKIKTSNLLAYLDTQWYGDPASREQEARTCTHHSCLVTDDV